MASSIIYRPLLARAVRNAIRTTLLPATLMLPLALPEPAKAQTPPVSQTLPAAVPAAGSNVSTPNGPASLEGLPILHVEVVGNTRTPTTLILDQVRAQEGQPYSSALVEVDNRAIAAMDRFITTKVNIKTVENETTHALRGVVVIFAVEERPVIASVEIIGNRKFGDTQLREGLLVRPGVAVDPFRIETDRKTIIDMYHKKGYADISVNVDAKLLKDKGIVRYEIVEGPSARINSIVFEGNANLSAQYIKWRIQTKSYFWIFRKGLLDEEALQQDVVTIRDLYYKRGFIDARVSYSLDFSEDKSRLTVRFVIIEGPRYRVGTINVTGNKIFGTSELLGDTTRFGPGSFAERDRIDALQHRIEDVYGHQGYINRNIEVTPAYTSTPGVVDLNITITEGTPYIVGRVIVRGNQDIQDRVIRRQVRIYPDQTFDMVQVKKSIERLNAAHIFKAVKITPITAQDNAADVKDALVEVSEGQTGKFSAGAGVSTNEGLVGQFSVEQQNFDIANPPRSWGEFFRGQGFKGAGQFFRILLEPGTEFQRYRVTFEEPYLFDTPYSFGNDLYYYTRGRESWDETRIGDIVTLGRRFGDIWSVSLAFRAEQVEIKNAQDFGVLGVSGSTVIGTQTYYDSAQEILDQEGSHFITSIKPGISRDTTDSRAFPTSGTRTSLSLEQYGAFGGDLDISKIIFSFDWYKTIYTDLFDRKTVLAIRNQVGVIPYGTSAFYERFYLGGIGELRGFKFRGISPRAGPLGDPIGGDFSWVTTAEVNYPIYEDLLRGVVFTDIGTVERDITINTVRADLGLGVRVTLPIFSGLPLALDFAYPISKADGDRTQLISVSLGASF